MRAGHRRPHDDAPRWFGLKENLLRRWPWLLLGWLTIAALCFHSDYRVRAQAGREVNRLAAGLLAAGPSLDLARLAQEPQLQSVTVLDHGEKVLASYRNPAAPSPAGYSTRASRDGLAVEVTASLPGYWASLTGLPLLMLSTLCLVLAVPARRVRDGETPGVFDTQGTPAPLTGTAGAVVLELDSELRIERVSRGVESFGQSTSELLGKPIGDFVERFHPEHPQALKGVKGRGGQRVDSVVSSTPVEGPGGARKIVVTVGQPTATDTGDLRARYFQLERLCDAVCDNARDAVLVLDASSTVLYANLAVSRALGQPQLLGEGLLNLLRPDDRFVFADALQAAIAGETTGVLEFSPQADSKVILEGAFHPIGAYQRHGEALAVGIFRDVSESQRLSAELERTRQRAGHSQKIEALGRMAGGVAHDFNNLLTAMVFNLEAAQASLEDDSPAQPFLQEMNLAMTRAGSVTRQLLLYSRKKPAEPRLVSCHGAVADATRLAGSFLGTTTLSTQLEAERDRVWLDDGQLDQVLLNLVVNAKDAIGGGGSIVITSANDDTEIVLRVTDDGPGVPLELQSKIFEPYFTTKEVGKGTGLGLSTATAIVEKAGGRFTLSSRRGETTFEIRLPVARDSVVPSAVPTGIGTGPRGAAPGVLLVEDEAGIRTLLHRMLETHGYRVTSVGTGTAATDILSSPSSFDVLITDLVLPGVSGPDLAKAFHRRQPEGPVLFISGFPGDTFDETTLGRRDRFLPKPFSQDQLLGALAEMLGEPVG